MVEQGGIDDERHRAAIVAALAAVTDAEIAHDAHEAGRFFGQLGEVDSADDLLSNLVDRARIDGGGEVGMRVAEV